MVSIEFLITSLVVILVPEAGELNTITTRGERIYIGA